MPKTPRDQPNGLITPQTFDEPRAPAAILRTPANVKYTAEQVNSRLRARILALFTREEATAQQSFLVLTTLLAELGVSTGLDPKVLASELGRLWTIETARKGRLPLPNTILAAADGPTTPEEDRRRCPARGDIITESHDWRPDCSSEHGCGQPAPVVPALTVVPPPACPVDSHPWTEMCSQDGGCGQMRVE